MKFTGANNSCIKIINLKIYGDFAMNSNGATLWYIPDGYLASPIGNDPIYKNHEAFCVMNVSDSDAHLKIDFYFADREPKLDVAVTLPAQRCYHIRTDDPAQLGGYQIPFDTPYGARIRSDVPVVVQYSRLYSTIHNISLMTTMAQPMDE
jgi:hypothetical protein